MRLGLFSSMQHFFILILVFQLIKDQISIGNHASSQLDDIMICARKKIRQFRVRESIAMDKQW